MDEEFELYLKALLDLVQNHQLVELCIKGPDLKIELRVAPVLTEAPAPRAVYASGPKHSRASFTHTPPRAKPNFDHLYELRSPLVGVVYRSPSTGAPFFVKPGDYVKAGQVVCLIEAMKVFNEISAERSGRVVDFCASNGEIVEVDQVLLRLDPHAARPEE